MPGSATKRNQRNDAYAKNIPDYEALPPFASFANS